MTMWEREEEECGGDSMKAEVIRGRRRGERGGGRGGRGDISKSGDVRGRGG